MFKEHVSNKTKQNGWLFGNWCTTCYSTDPYKYFYDDIKHLFPFRPFIFLLDIILFIIIRCSIDFNISAICMYVSQLMERYRYKNFRWVKVRRVKSYKTEFFIMEIRRKVKNERMKALWCLHLYRNVIL